MIESTACAAIRKTDGREWFDVEQLGILPEMAQDKANELDKQIPSWAQANPVQRIAEVVVRVLVIE